MDENRQDGHGGGNWCNCGMCQGWKHGMNGMNRWYGGHGHFLARMLVGLVILLMVFCLGIVVGEFKGELRARGYGYGQYQMMPLDGGYGNQMIYR